MRTATLGTTRHAQALGRPESPGPPGWRTEWRCPECRREYRAGGRCRMDGAALEALSMSEPFLWLG